MGSFLLDKPRLLGRLCIGFYNTRVRTYKNRYRYTHSPMILHFALWSVFVTGDAIHTALVVDTSVHPHLEMRPNQTRLFCASISLLPVTASHPFRASKPGPPQPGLLPPWIARHNMSFSTMCCGVCVCWIYIYMQNRILPVCLSTSLCANPEIERNRDEKTMDTRIHIKTDGGR